MLVKKILIGLALLCLYQTANSQTATYSMYDVLIGFNDARNRVTLNRNYTLQRQVRFVAPTFGFENWQCEPNGQVVAGQATLVLAISNAETGFAFEENLVSGQVVEFADLPPGYYDVRLTYNFIRDDGEECENGTLLEVGQNLPIVFRGIDFEVRQQDMADYNDLRPDEVRNYTTLYTPPFDNTYPSDSRWAKYNNPSFGHAIATIKLGEGNTQLTRPIFMIDGVDFREEAVTDPALGGAVVRYGSQGWENICQGLVARQKRQDDLEPDLFSEYPAIINDLLSGQDEKGETNFDVILVDFEDGADYVQKNAQLLRTIIEDINSTKACGYKNILVGLSMGGQVSKFALGSMEEDGIDHDFSHYISYDSPHKDANVALSIQAFLYAGANVVGLEEAAENWYSLNRPGAVQLLRYNLIELVEDNTILFEHKRRLTPNGPSIDIDFVDVGHNHQQLYDNYVIERESFGLPDNTINIAIANGSGLGEPQFEADNLPDCLFDTDLEVPILDLPEIESAALTLQMNVAGSAADTLMYLRVFSPEDLRFHEVIFHNNPTLLELGSAPGCRRNDISDISNQLTDLGESTFGLVDLVPNHFKRFSTFMPTASVLNIETDNLLLNLDEEISDGNIIVPFDEFYLPANNEDHVISNNGNQEFLLNMVNNGVVNLLNTISLPSQLKGTTYNYGRNNSLIANFEISAGAQLLVNNLVQTGFTDVFPEGEITQDYFATTTVNNCTNSSVLINQGGAFIIGEEDDQQFSGEVTFGNKSNLTLKSTASLTLYNSSQLIFTENSVFTIEEGANISLVGNNTRLVLAGDMILSGDVAIYCEGIIILEESASITGGKLTVNGVNMNDRLMSVSGVPLITSDIHLTNGKVLFDVESSLVINSPTINSPSDVTLENIVLIKPDEDIDFQPMIDIPNGNNIVFDGIRSANSHFTKAIRVSKVNSGGTLSLANSSFYNLYSAIEVFEFGTVELTNNTFTSVPVTANGTTIEISNGVKLGDVDNVSLTNNDFEGFGNFYDSVTDNYALHLTDCPLVNIADSDFTDNRTGIYVPFDPEVQQYGVQSNNTNLFLDNTLFQDNFTGIEMYGYSTEFVNVNSSGFISMECVRMYDNFYGVLGENVRVQADHYFSNEESSINIFRPIPKGSPGGGGGGSVSFYVTYTNQSYSHIYLRGNAWYDFDSNELFLNADGSWAQVVKQPGIDAQSTDQFFGCIETVVIDYPCVGCFQQEDDDDCNFIQNSENTNIAAIYRDAIEAVRDRDFAVATQRFTPLATIESSLSSSGLPAKCAYQTDISRVFARPSAGDAIIGKREASSKTFSIVPNPSSDFISLQDGTDTHIEIYSSTGEKLIDKNYRAGDRIDVSELAPGLYFLQDTYSKETSRFIVIR